MRYNAGKQRTHVRLYNNHGNQENNRHDNYADSEQFFQIFECITRKAQQDHNANAPDGSDNVSGYASERTYA